MAQIASQNEYGTRSVMKPKYRLDQVTRNGTGGDVTMNAGGGESLIFEMVAQPWNKARSVLAFKMRVPLAAGTNICAFVNNLAIFRTIQFYGKNNVVALDLQYPDVFTRIMANSDHSLDELFSVSDTPLYPLGQDPNFNSYAPHTHAGSTLTDGAVAANAVTNLGLTITAATASSGGAEARYAVGANANNPYSEQAYFAWATNNTNLDLYYRIPFSYFKNTILAEDKDVVYPDITYVKFIMAPYTNAGFASATTAVVSKATPAALAAGSAPVLSNVYIYQAMQTNPDINNALYSMLDNGTQELSFSWVDCQTVPTAANATQNMYVKYGPGLGLRLKRLYWTVLPTTMVTSNLRYDINNVNGAKLLYFRTSLDSKLIQQYNIDCTDANGNQDYMIMRELLKGSTLINRNIYQYNWFWCENFGAEEYLCDHNNNLIGGIDITQKEIKYDVNAVAAGGINAVANTYYFYGIIQRKLKITRMGLEII